MRPAFDSWTAFLAMGGYGFYVWLALILTVLPLVGLLFYGYLQQRNIRRAIIIAARRKVCRDRSITEREAPHGSA